MPDATDVAELAQRAAAIRRRVLRMAAGRGEGYAGQGLGVADIMAVLFFRVLHLSVDNPRWAGRDRFVLSVGHYAIALYAALAEAGVIDDERLAAYAADGDVLPASTHHGVPGVESTTGSLAQGFSLACGMALAARLQRRSHRVIALCSDGEQQEGSTWEAAMFAAHQKLDNLTVLVDLNRTQADGDLGQVLEVEPLRKKYAAFGWSAIEVDGNDIDALVDALEQPTTPGLPTAVICRTKLGAGVRAISEQPRAHFVRVDDEVWAAALQELEASR